jgi:exonuclease SbcC
VRRVAEQADDVAERLLALDQRQQSLSDGLQQVELRLAQQLERAEQAAVRGRSLRQQLAELLGGGTDVHEVRKRELRIVQVLEHAVETLAAVDSAEAELCAAEQECRTAVEAAGFSSADDARSALVDPDQLEKLAAMIEEVHTTEAALDAALRDPDVDVDVEVPAGVPQAEQAFRDATEAARAAAAAAARARHRATELEALAPAFEVQLQELRPLRQRMQEIRALADLAAGQGSNRLRMTLSAFVLAARLEEVAAVASERLRRMTQGRYTLVHTDAGRGGGRAGLGLLARDSWTGQDRDTATLSGGETFLASLALALALGDVVTAEAGGAGVEALFVDEGFGSLDEETLEEVMDTLDSLREGGRMVGLVSHVGELRARIPAQLHVHKTRAGSTLTLRTA